MRYHPFSLYLRGEDILVVGGGRVAERKVRGLLKSGARVRLVSPEATVRLQKLNELKAIRWIKRQIKESDVKSARLIISSTDDRQVNARVSRWAKKKKIWVNVVDNVGLSSLISPAVFRCARAIVAVYTDGRNPELSRDLKNYLKERKNDFLSYRNRLSRRSH